MGPQSGHGLGVERQRKNFKVERWKTEFLCHTLIHSINIHWVPITCQTGSWPLLPCIRLPATWRQGHVLRERWLGSLGTYLESQFLGPLPPPQRYQFRISLQVVLWEISQDHSWRNWIRSSQELWGHSWDPRFAEDPGYILHSHPRSVGVRQ